MISDAELRKFKQAVADALHTVGVTYIGLVNSVDTLQRIRVAAQMAVRGVQAQFSMDPVMLDIAVDAHMDRGLNPANDKVMLDVRVKGIWADRWREIEIGPPEAQPAFPALGDVRTPVGARRPAAPAPKEADWDDWLFEPGQKTC